MEEICSPITARDQPVGRSGTAGAVSSPAAGGNSHRSISMPMIRLLPLTHSTEEENASVPLSPQEHLLFFSLLFVFSIPAIVGMFFAARWLWLFVTR